MSSQFFNCIGDNGVPCGNVIEFTEQEQKWYQERDFSPPKRCRECREKKRERFGDKKR